MASNDKQWDEMLGDAVVFQQSIYEQIPDWTILTSDELDSLRKYILIAICRVSYDKEEPDLPNTQKKQIDGLVKILETRAKTPTEEYCFGIVYVVTFRCRNKKTTVTNDDKSMSCIPIFKTRTYTDKNNFNSSYIDPNCRVYNSWDDFLNNNKLPSCTMAYPHDGYYQPNPDFEIKEDYSDVWVSYRDSPAATNSFTKKGDIVSSVLGVASGVATIASCVTPLAPVVLTGALVGGVASGVWSIGRESMSIVDRYKHKESIGLKDKIGRRHWLGVAGSAASVATTGGSALIATAAAKGKNIGLISRAAFNTFVAGDIACHGVGIGLQIFDTYKDYKENNSVNINVTQLVTSVFFFGNAILKAQTAASIIQSNQNTIIETYKQSLSTKRFRKSFKRMKKKCLKRADSETAAQNEIVRRIRKVTSTNDLFRSVPVTTVPKSSPVNVYFEKSVLIVNGIELLDIVLFTKFYAKPIVLNCGRQLFQRYAKLHNQTNNEQEIFSQLMQTFETLFFENSSKTSSYTAQCINPALLSRFRRIIDDMQSLSVSVNVLPILFNIARNLFDIYNGSVDMLICDGIEVLWHYLITCVENYLQRITIELCNDNLREIVLQIINALVAGLNIMKGNLMRAFTVSMHH